MASSSNTLQFLRFLIVGFINTFIGISIIYAGKYFLGLGDVPANVVGYLMGLSVSFIFHSRWTFNYQGSQSAAAIKFAVSVVIAYMANLLAVLACINLAGINAYVSQAVGMPIYTIVFYLASRFFIFRKIDANPSGASAANFD